MTYMIKLLYKGKWKFPRDYHPIHIFSNQCTSDLLRKHLLTFSQPFSAVAYTNLVFMYTTEVAGRKMRPLMIRDSCNTYSTARKSKASKSQVAGVEIELDCEKGLPWLTICLSLFHFNMYLFIHYYVNSLNQVSEIK